MKRKTAGRKELLSGAMCITPPAPNPPLQTFFIFFILWLLLFYIYFFAHWAAVTVKRATNYTVTIHLSANLASHLSDSLAIYLSTMDLSFLSLFHLSHSLQTGYLLHL